jgi:hypothetical protein
LALSRYGRHADECSLSGADSRFNGLTITGSSGCQLANPLVKIARNAAADMVHFAGDWAYASRTKLSHGGGPRHGAWKV